MEKKSHRPGVCVLCVTGCRSNVRQDALSSEEETEGQKEKKDTLRSLKSSPMGAPPTQTHPHWAQLPFVRTQRQKGQDLDVVGEAEVKLESR